jgi:hypothetical protein
MQDTNTYITVLKTFNALAPSKIENTNLSQEVTKHATIPFIYLQKNMLFFNLCFNKK